MKAEDVLAQRLCVANMKESGISRCFGVGARICKTCALLSVDRRNVPVLGPGVKVVKEGRAEPALRIVLFELYLLRGKYDAESRAKHDALIKQKRELESKIAARNARGR